MILLASCVADEAKPNSAHEVVRPLLHDDDLLLSQASDGGGIAAAYNRFIQIARSLPECDALVLMHDDVEVFDPNFRPKLLAALREPGVGVLGVIGAAGLTSLGWWDARLRAGGVLESRGPVQFGRSHAEVDVVDGLIMALAPVAYKHIAFDEASCPAFHGYDVDYCLQVRAAGLRVLVRPVDLFHRTKGGYGDQAAFYAVDQTLRAKWPAMIRPLSTREHVSLLPRQTYRWSKRIYLGTRWLQFRHPLSGATAAPPAPGSHLVTYPLLSAQCAACGSGPSEPVAGIPHEPCVLVCPTCGTGHSSPPPQRQPESDDIWTHQYGNSRLPRRETWFAEARQRIAWIQLFQPEGSLLEVGCGTGEFLKVADDAGYDVFGVEPSHWASAHAQDLGLPVESGFLSDWQSTHQGFRPDVIALWHVLEHMPDPLDFLDSAAKALTPQGYLFVEVPNFASSSARERNWDGLQLEDHHVHYTPVGVDLLLRRAGLDVVQVLPITRRTYTSPLGWRRERNLALLERRPWPSQDLLRAVARAR